MKIIRINAVWCSGCLVMHKVWNEIEKKYPNLEIVNLDYDMDEEEVMKYNPGDILPIAIFYKNDEEVARLVGEHKLSEIEELVNEEN